MASIQARVGSYVVTDTLGRGAFGAVRLATHVVTGHAVALKFLSRAKISGEDTAARVRREIAALRFLKHPHIIKLYEVVHTPKDLVLVMEYAGDELFHHIAERGRLGEDEARRFFQQLVSAIEYCHRHGIVHRDLKPENLMLDARRNLKIADFGLSNTLRDGDFLNTSCGSPNYAAPEVISGKMYAGPEVDIWSLGVILYVMLVGRLPFDDDYIPALFQKISTGVYTVPSFVSPDARSLIASMLTVDPLRRITIPEIRSHPFFVRNLPPYLEPLPAHLPGDDPSDPLDPTIIEELSAKLGLPRANVIDRLSAPAVPVDDPIHVAYALCLDNRIVWSGRRAQMAVRDAAWSAGSSASTPANAPSPITGMNDLSSTSASQHINEQSNTIGVLARAEPLLPPSLQSTPPTRAKKARSRWHVGIRSRSNPLDVMLELYKAMKSVGMAWKTTSPFTLRAKTTAPPITAIDIQLFKVDTNYYLVDFKLATQTTPLHPPIQRLTDQQSSLLSSTQSSVSTMSNMILPSTGASPTRPDDVERVINTFSFLDVTVKIITELASSG